MLEQVLFILFSPLFLYWQCTSKDRARQGRGSDGSTTIFNTALVSEASSDGSDTALSVTQTRDNSNTTRKQYKASTEKDDIECFQNLRKEICRRGISEDAASVIISSWRSSTRKQYGTYLQKWLSFCSAEQIDQFNPSINCVVKFLNKLLQDGLGYSAINTAKSAISSAVSVVNNISIGIHPLIKKFMNGVYNCKPTLPRQSATWDVNLVLRYLKSLYPHENLSLKQLSYKLIVLLALATGQRIQTLYFVDLKNGMLSPKFIKIRIGDLLKQTKVGQDLTELYIEEYKQDKAICVVEAFHAYVEKTKMLRGGYSQLFIGLQKPHTPVTKSTYTRISFYSRNTHLLPPKPKSSFSHLKRGIQDFHMNYVLVPADKAANNVVVV